MRASQEQQSSEDLALGGIREAMPFRSGPSLGVHVLTPRMHLNACWPDRGIEGFSARAGRRRWPSRPEHAPVEPVTPPSQD